jgi:hypothetical protein
MTAQEHYGSEPPDEPGWTYTGAGKWARAGPLGRGN